MHAVGYLTQTRLSVAVAIHAPFIYSGCHLPVARCFSSTEDSILGGGLCRGWGWGSPRGSTRRAVAEPSVSQEDYSTTIIGVPDKSYIWIMARTPTVDQAPSKFEA